jgi:hypothetical protein
MQFRRLPPFGGDPRAVAEILNGVMDGKTNNTGTITLETGNATSTTLYDARISIDTKIVLLPFSSAAFADDAPYGEFANNNDQTAPSTGTSAVVEWDTTEKSSGVYISDDTRVNVRNAGTYSVQYSLQLANYDNAGQYADVWLRKGGTDIDNSGKRYYLPARKAEGEPSHVVGTYETLITCSAGDYIEVAGSVSDTDVTLEHFAADVGIPRPAIPAANIIVKLVSPLAYSNIYVSSQSSGEAVISHYANSTSDKTYAYILVG